MNHNPGFLQLVERVRARVKECTVADVLGLPEGELGPTGGDGQFFGGRQHGG